MRIGHVKIEDLFASVDWCLKNTFPEDYDARCLYNACAIYTLLSDQGIKASIVGGNVGIFTMSVDAREALIEGFGGGNDNQPSHFWVKSDGVILDPGPSYLPKRSRLMAVDMPMIAWRNSSELPNYLQYVEKIVYAEEVEFNFPGEIENRVSDFITICKKRFTSKVAKKKLPTWILSSPKELHEAAKSGDKWAKGALRFLSMKSVPTIPR